MLYLWLLGLTAAVAILWLEFANFHRQVEDFHNVIRRELVRLDGATTGKQGGI